MDLCHMRSPRLVPIFELAHFNSQASVHIQFSNSDSVDDGIDLKKLCYKLYDSAYLHYNRLYTAQLGRQEEAAEAYDIAAIKFRGTSAVTNFDVSSKY
ncbi:hypothetical protein SCA6_003769 [Theobroma cacao]